MNLISAEGYNTWQDVSGGDNLCSEKQIDAALKKVRKSNGPAVVCLTKEVEAFDPLRLLNNRRDSDLETSFFWQQPSRNRSFVTGSSLKEIVPHGSDHFLSLSREINKTAIYETAIFPLKHLPAIPCWVGGIQFDTEKTPDESIHSTRFYLPEWIYMREKENAWFRVYLTISPQMETDDVYQKVINKLSQLFCRIKKAVKDGRTFSSFNMEAIAENEISESIFDNWSKAVEQIKAQIAEREIQKLVLARNIELKTDNEIEPVDVAHFLRSEYPGCTTLMVKTGKDSFFIASTPEHILTLDHTQLFTESLAGSSSRGEEIVADQKSKYSLLSSDKNLTEHCIVRDDILSQLENLVDNLEFPRTPQVKQLANVQHLHTPIKGTLKNGTDAFTLLSKLHPTPAVGGYPRYKIQSMIRKLEGFDRGWYASPVGWLDHHGNAEFVVAIRCGYLKGNKARLYAGCGIVRESNAELEWEETKLKFMPLLHAIRKS